jgi:hypothetical protein
MVAILTAVRSVYGTVAGVVAGVGGVGAAVGAAVEGVVAGVVVGVVVLQPANPAVRTASVSSRADRRTVGFLMAIPSFRNGLRSYIL